jgi:hypothetical protein
MSEITTAPALAAGAAGLPALQNKFVQIQALSNLRDWLNLLANPYFFRPENQFEMSPQVFKKNLRKALFFPP